MSSDPHDRYNALLEPSFADLIAAIEQAPELSEQTRRHWVCSLRQIARWLDRPAAVIPARWNAVQISVAQLHHARVGVTAKTLANHKSNVRAALRWFGKEHDVPQLGVPLSAEWATLRDRLDKRHTGTALQLHALLLGPPHRARRRSTTGSLMSIGATAPRRPHCASNNTARRFLARSWNACASCNRWLAAAAAHRAAHQSYGQSPPGRTSLTACAATRRLFRQGSPSPAAV